MGSSTQPESDHRLVQRAQRGDPDAVPLLYVRYRRKILNYLYRYTGDRSAAEELTQETFLRVVQHLHRYRPTGSVAGWIYRIASNLGSHTLRHRRQSRTISLDEPVVLDGEEAVDRAEAIPGSSSRPDEEAVQTEREVAVQRQLQHLPPQYLRAVILCDIEGYSYRETAEMLQCPINTVASRLARGRALLAKSLGYLKDEGDR